MPIESYPDQIEPENQDAVIWRFIQMWKFRDLMETGELYFRRADLLPDAKEGLPPEGYHPFPNLNPLDLRDRQTINNSSGSVAQFREAFYVNCWYLFREETCKMWSEYGDDGVAICSSYRLLKAALDVLNDRACLGLVRYSADDMTGYNLFRFIFNKGSDYRDESEVRALLWIMHPHAGGNRHIDIDNRVHSRPLTPPPSEVPDGVRRKVDLQGLITGIVVSPWASSTTLDEITQLVKDCGLVIPVLPSELTRYRDFLIRKDEQIRPVLG